MDSDKHLLALSTAIRELGYPTPKITVTLHDGQKLTGRLIGIAGEHSLDAVRCGSNLSATSALRLLGDYEEWECDVRDVRNLVMD
jgi:hypothetical protein